MRSTQRRSQFGFAQGDLAQQPPGGPLPNRLSFVRSRCNNGSATAGLDARHAVVGPHAAYAK